MHTKALDLSNTGVGHRRLFGQPALDNRPHQHMAAMKKDKIGPRGPVSRHRGGSEGMEQEGAKRQRPETRTRDSPAQSSRTGRLDNPPSETY